MLYQKPVLRARLVTKLEFEKYEQLLDQLHYLGSSPVSLTKRLRYVVVNENDEWCALLDFGNAALKNTSLDNYLGWKEVEKSNRLKYVLNNTRFLVLPWMKSRYKNLASQALALTTKRLSGDWQYYHGHHILFLETFVESSRPGTCYKAANWLEVGETKGYGKRGGSYVYHGNKKKVFVFALHKKAKEILSSTGFAHPILSSDKRKPMLDINTINLDDLESIFIDIPDHRPKPEHGNIFPASKILLVAACAFLSGYTSYNAIGDYVKYLSVEAVAKFRFKKDLRKRPEESCIRKFMNQLDANLFQERIYEWLKKSGYAKKIKHIAIDGKAMCACIGEDSGRAIINVTAVDAQNGITLATKQVDQKSNEIPAVQEMLDTLPIKNTIVSLDAMHAQKETAKKILEKGGEYILTVKDNQQTLLQDIIRLHEKSFSP